MKLAILYRSPIQLQIEAQFVCDATREWYNRIRIGRDQPRNRVLPHHNAKPLIPLGHDPVLALIGSARQIREIDVDGFLSLSLASESVDTVAVGNRVTPVPPRRSVRAR